MMTPILHLYDKKDEAWQTVTTVCRVLFRKAATPRRRPHGESQSSGGKGRGG